MTLRVGIIGLGVGERHIDGFSKDPRCEVVSICDFNPRKLKDVSSRHPNISTYKDANLVLDDPEIDVVSIASYDNHHYNQIVRAAMNGKHIFVEKPLCLLGEEFQDVAGVMAKHSDLQLSSNLILRRSPRFMCSLR